MEHYGILLIDDERTYGAIVRALLAPAGCEVTCVATLDAAIGMAQQACFDLIVIDIELCHERGGYEPLVALRDAASWVRRCPAIAFTTLSPEGGDVYFRERGFDGWLHKPFTAADAIALVQRWLDASASLPVGGHDALAVLLGAEQAARMADRFFASMEDAMAAIDGGADPAGYGHRIGGLAGTLGFPVLSAAWLGLQDGDSASWPTVRALSREAIEHR